VIEFVDPRPPVSADALAEAEAQLAELGHPLPPSYKAFLAESDGGVPVRDRFSFQQDDRTQDDAVQTFFGVAPVPSPGLNLLRTIGILGERVPAGVLPIATDPLGNFICLDARDGHDGPVLFWDHEYEGDPPDEANLYEIAPDLPAFLDSLSASPAPATVEQPRGWRRLLRRG
jgi:hypothetical protein